MLEQYIAGLDGVYGIAARRLDGGEPVLINADRRYASASLYKLLVMYRVFQKMESGTLSPGDVLTIQPGDMQDAGSDEGLSVGDRVTVERALEAMITVSSNAASFALVRAVGGWSYTMGAAQELGMPNTYLDDYAWSSPSDMFKFLELLARRQLVSPSASDRMVELMKRQQIDNRIPALLPDGVEVAHKTGELENVRNDAGIVFARQRDLPGGLHERRDHPRPGGGGGGEDVPHDLRPLRGLLTRFSALPLRLLPPETPGGGFGPPRSLPRAFPLSP